MRAEDWDWGSRCFPWATGVQLLVKPKRRLTQLVHVVRHACYFFKYCMFSVCDIYLLFPALELSYFFFLCNYLCTSLSYSSYCLKSDWDSEDKQLSIILYDIQLSEAIHPQTPTKLSPSSSVEERNCCWEMMRRDPCKEMRLSKMQQDMGVCSWLLISGEIRTAHHSTHRLVWQLLHLHSVIRSSWEDTKARNFALFS